MTEGDLKQACINLSKAALTLFDVLDTKGVDAPLEDMIALSALKDVVDITYELRDHYLMHSTLRLLGMGVSAKQLLEMRESGR